MDHGKQLITIRDTAGKLSVHPNTVRKLINGELAGAVVRIGTKSVRLDEGKVDSYIEQKTGAMLRAGGAAVMQTK